jgi:hypothetical protein
MDDRLHPAHEAADERAIGNRADSARVGRLEQVDPYDVMAVGPEDADQRLAEVPGAAGDEDAQR